MLNLFNNYKLHMLLLALISSLAINVNQRFQHLKDENKLVICQGNLTANNIAIESANKLASQLEKQLRLREQEAAKARAESLKRMDDILKATVPQDCNGAMQWMAQQANF